MVRIGEATSVEELEAVRGLMRAYGAHLAGGVGRICIANYEAEIQGLPGVYAAPGGVLLLATVEGAAAGCVALRPFPEIATAAGGCELKRLWVESGFRGLGLGRRLMDAAIAWAREAGCGAVYLDTVAAAMPEANALYGRMGFERVDRYNDNPVAEVIFYRLLLD